MKKSLLFLMVIMVLVLLTACATPSNINTSSSDTSQRNESDDSTSSALSADSSTESSNSASNSDSNTGNNDSSAVVLEPDESMMHIKINGKEAYGYYHAYNGREYALEHDGLYEDIFPYATKSNETRLEIEIHLDMPMNADVEEAQLKANFWGKIFAPEKNTLDDVRDNVVSFEYNEETRNSIKIVVEIDEPLTSNYMLLLFVPLWFNDGYSGTLHIGVKADQVEITKGEAIIIAQNHFYANYNPTPFDGYTYTAEFLKQDAGYYYIIFWQTPTREDTENDVMGGCLTYKIDKFSGKIVNLEPGE